MTWTTTTVKVRIDIYGARLVLSIPYTIVSKLIQPIDHSILLHVCSQLYGTVYNCRFKSKYEVIFCFLF